LGGGPPPPRGTALQLRINAETMLPSGEVQPATGTLTAFEIPSGPGVRVDTDGFAGYVCNPRFDSLLAKLVVHSTAGVDGALGKAARALDEFRIDGVATNRGFLRRLLARPEVAAWSVTTRFVDDHAAALADAPRRCRLRPVTGTEHTWCARRWRAASSRSTCAPAMPCSAARSSR